MNAIEIATQFNDARDVLRRLLGSKFESVNEPYCQALQERMSSLKLSVMEAAIHLLKESDEAVPDEQDRACAHLNIMAAAVELIEGGKTQKSVEALTKAPNNARDEICPQCRKYALVVKDTYKLCTKCGYFSNAGQTSPVA